MVAVLKQTIKNQNQINSKIAISNRLFQSGWHLNSILHKIYNGEIAAIVNLHYEDNKPVAVFVEIVEDDYFSYKSMIFVKKEYRNRGIGSKLLQKSNPDRKSLVGTGTNDSLRFWEKNGFEHIVVI
jgi:GNAT superfamily N-acetyltransferase